MGNEFFWRLQKPSYEFIGEVILKLTFGLKFNKNNERVFIAYKILIKHSLFFFIFINY